MAKIKFTISRDGDIVYEAEKPEGFDEMNRGDQWIALLELPGDPGCEEIGGDTHQLNIYVGDSDNPL